LREKLFALYRDLEKNHHAAVFTFLCCIVISLYYKAIFTTTFFYDDYASIIINPAIGDFLNLKQIFDSFNTRFLVGFSFALNYALSKFDPAGYRLIDILIHILNSYALYRLIILFIGRRLPAFLACVIYAVHPLATEPVNFITQRYVVLATFFYVHAVIFYFKWRTGDKAKHYALTFIFTISAMFCKEFTVTLPLMFILVEIFYFRSKKRNWFALIMLLMTLTVIPLTLLNTSSRNNVTAAIARTNGKDKVDITRAAPIGRLEYLLTEINVVRTYIRLVFLPYNQNVLYDYPKGKPDLITFFSFVFLMLVAGAAIYFYKYNKMVTFGVLWFFLALSIESSFIPIGHSIAEYRMYLPLMGWCIVFAGGFSFVTNVLLSRILAIIFIAILSILTLMRNQAWASEKSLWEDVVQKSPNLSRGYVNLGDTLVRLGQYPEALKNFEKALERSNDGLTPMTSIWWGFCNAYSHLQNPALAEQYYLKLLSIKSEENKVLRIIAYFYFKNRLYEPAIEYFNRSVKLHGYHPDVSYYLMTSYLRLGKFELAKEVIEKSEREGDQYTAKNLDIIYRRVVK
jgi:protein O-mannosyl-transferase